MALISKRGMYCFYSDYFHNRTSVKAFYRALMLFFIVVHSSQKVITHKK